MPPHAAVADETLLVGVSWVCRRFSVASTTVHHAIKTGALPAVPVLGASGVSAYAIRPPDAVELWGHRITPEGPPTPAPPTDAPPRRISSRVDVNG